MDGSSHVQKFEPIRDCRNRDICFVAGSGYTGVLSFYPTLFAQALTRLGFTVYGIEYEGYGATAGDAARLNLRRQRLAFLRAGQIARAQGFTRVVGIAWAMGALGLFGAASEQHGLFDSLIACNGLLSAPLVHQHVIAELRAEKRAVEDLRRTTPAKHAKFIDIPPLDYNAFREKVLAMNDNEIYGGFAGYPLDFETTRVVLRDLADHHDWRGAKQHG